MIYNDNEKMLIFLSSFDFMTYAKEEKLLALFNEPKDIKTDYKKFKNEIISIFDERIYNKMLSNLDDVYIETFIREMLKKGIEIVTLYSRFYPEKLKNISAPPFHLFTKGDLSLLNTKSIGIVGTRHPTAYGRSVTEDFAKKLSKNELTIVSGLAYGVDSIAHKSCLEEGGNTIAVLGCGFDKIYPKEHFELAHTIAQRGLLVSEYLPHIQAEFFYFPVRNRIIAGLSESVLITEAGIKSGVMHTKEYALDYGRDVYAVPGNITSKMSEGTNLLIKSNQAICVTDVDEILRNYQITYVVNKREKPKLNINQQMIVDYLEDGEKHFEEILNITKLDTKTLNSCLTTLEISEIIRKLEGNYYSLL